MAFNKGMFSGIIIMFVALIIGISLLSTTADTTASMTDVFSTSNKSFTAQNNTAVSFVASDQTATAISAVRNSTGSALSSPADYSADLTAGTITMAVAYGGTTETWYVDYSYTDDNYIDDNAARNITGLIVLFFALAIVFGSLMFIDWESLGFMKR